MSFEQVILSGLVYNEEYARKVIPFLKEEYFQEKSERVVYSLIDSYVKKYSAFPSKESLYIDLSNKDDLDENTFNASKTIIQSLEQDSQTKVDWLVDNTEKFCQDKALHNAIYTSIKILDDKTGKLSKGSIPSLLADALAVSFNSSIGHDYIDDAENRYEIYHKVEHRIPFDLEHFNIITRGGLPRKTLNVVLAGTGVGKTQFMCHCAAANLMAGHNVLYITLEMAEEKIAERIDANLLDVTTEEMLLWPKETFQKKIQKVKDRTVGKLIIKEYPTVSAGANTFRHLLNELRIKKNFKPDIIYVDYINICVSSRLKFMPGVNSYTYVKAIAEELRGLAAEYDVPLMTGTQVTRSGFKSSDIGLEDTAESFGLPATADLMFALIQNEELADLNQILVKQLKNRLSDPSKHRRFVIGIDRAKMRFYDVEQSAQDDIVNDKPVMDQTSIMGFDDIKPGVDFATKFNKKMFEDFR